MASQESTKLPSSSSHRLPTVSASQALQNLKSRGSRRVSTGLAQLNKFLSPHGITGTFANRSGGGLVRGQVTEIYGPPGVGKTGFGMQAAVNALNAGDQVVWVDTAAPMVARRLHEMLSAARPTKSLGVETSQPNLSLEEMQGHFHYYTTPTLAHLLAMFVHPPAVFPPPNTSLIVIDSLSTLFDNAYPRNADDGASKSKNDTTRWAAGRKFSVMNELVSKLGRIAAMHNIAVLITCQTITRIRAGWGALLLPAMSGVEWDNGISTRLVLFRDWLPGKGKWNDCDLDRLRRARFVGVVKANGVMLAADEGGVGTVVPFTIEASGLCDLNFAAVDIAPPPLTSPARPPKRTFAEIADSEDEEPDLDEHYGWVEDDEVAAEGLIIDEASLIYDLNTTSPQKEAAPDTLLSRREGPTG